MLRISYRPSKYAQVWMLLLKSRIFEGVSELPLVLLRSHTEDVWALPLVTKHVDGTSLGSQHHTCQCPISRFSSQTTKQASAVAATSLESKKTAKTGAHPRKVKAALTAHAANVFARLCEFLRACPICFLETLATSPRRVGNTSTQARSQPLSVANCCEQSMQY